MSVLPTEVRVEPMKAKKLSLRRETLAELDRNALGRAGGGSYLCPSFAGYPTLGGTS